MPSSILKYTYNILRHQMESYLNKHILYLFANMPYLLKPMILITHFSIDPQVCGIDFIATP